MKGTSCNHVVIAVAASFKLSPFRVQQKLFCCDNQVEDMLQCMWSGLTAMFIAGKIDPSFIITHRLPLSEAAKGYQIFNNKEEQCVKVVLKPGMK